MKLERIEANCLNCSFLNSLPQMYRMKTPDRRVQKTRKAIYEAFAYLVVEKGYEKLSVQDVIDRANVGRSTFYSHYESKELLLAEMTEHLFHHVFKEGGDISLRAYLEHICLHFKRNQDCVANLLLEQNDYFMRALKKEIVHDVFPKIDPLLPRKKQEIPQVLREEFLVSGLITSLTWWLKDRERVSEAELVTHYFSFLGIEQN